MRAGRADRPGAGPFRRRARGPDAARAYGWRPGERSRRLAPGWRRAGRPEPVSGADAGGGEEAGGRRRRRRRRVVGSAGAVRVAARERRARGDRQRTAVGALAGRASTRAGAGGGGGVARADARARRQRLPAADRQPAARGRCLAARIPMPRLYALDFVRRRWARERERAGAHTLPARGPEPARGSRSPRRYAGASGSWRSTRRRC